jgi:hypothetical protein
MGKHNIYQRSHINKRIIYQKMIMKVLSNKWEMPHFKSSNVFFKECEYAILQQYAIGQIPNHFLKIEKISLPNIIILGDPTTCHKCV